MSLSDYVRPSHAEQALADLDMVEESLEDGEALQFALVVQQEDIPHLRQELQEAVGDD